MDNHNLITDIRSINIPKTLVDPSLYSKNQRDSLLEDACGAYKKWAAEYMTRHAAAIEEDDTDFHELDDMSVDAFVEIMYEYYDTSIDPRDSGRLPDMTPNEIKIAMYESCLNPGSCSFPFKGDSLSREVVFDYILKLRLNGLPFKQGSKECS